MIQDSVKNTTVLLVEDEQSLRVLLNKLMNQLGYEVSIAKDGLEALELYEKTGPVSLLITDIMMPGLNGLELGEKLRHNQPDLPILFISGYLNNETCNDINKFGDNVYSLRKPFTLRALSAMIEEILSS